MNRERLILLISLFAAAAFLLATAWWTSDIRNPEPNVQGPAAAAGASD